MGYDANDEKQVKKARKQAEIDAAMRLDTIRNIMSTPPGRKWIYEMLERCHCYSTSFIAGAPDASAFREGERNIGLQLLADVQTAASETYLAMLKEAKNSSNTSTT